MFKNQENVLELPLHEPFILSNEFRVSHGHCVLTIQSTLKIYFAHKHGAVACWPDRTILNFFYGPDFYTKSIRIRTTGPDICVTMFKNQGNVLELPSHEPFTKYVKWVSCLSRPSCPYHTVYNQNIFCTQAWCSCLLTW